MREQEPMTQTMKASKARQEWSQVLNRVHQGNTRVVVEKSGIPVAAIISAKDLERFKALEAQRRQDFQALRDTWEAFKDVPADELEREAAQAISEVRAEKHRAETPQPAKPA